MRLTDLDIQTIKRAILAYDSEAQVWLFGSRVDDSKRGGDIDLFVLSPSISRDKLRDIKMALYDGLGEQKIDLVIESDFSSPLGQIVLKEGVCL